MEHVGSGSLFSALLFFSSHDSLISISHVSPQVYRIHSCLCTTSGSTDALEFNPDNLMLPALLLLLFFCFFFSLWSVVSHRCPGQNKRDYLTMMFSKTLLLFSSVFDSRNILLLLLLLLSPTLLYSSSSSSLCYCFFHCKKSVRFLHLIFSFFHKKPFN